MEFQTMYSTKISESSPVGSETKSVYKWKFDKLGRKFLIKTDEVIDTQKQIQLFADDGNFTKQIKKQIELAEAQFNRKMNANDVEAIAQSMAKSNGYYADLTPYSGLSEEQLADLEPTDSHPAYEGAEPLQQPETQSIAEPTVQQLQEQLAALTKKMEETKNV